MSAFVCRGSSRILSPTIKRRYKSRRIRVQRHEEGAKTGVCARYLGSRSSRECTRACRRIRVHTRWEQAPSGSPALFPSSRVTYMFQRRSSALFLEYTRFKSRVLEEHACYRLACASSGTCLYARACGALQAAEVSAEQGETSAGLKFM